MDNFSVKRLPFVKDGKKWVRILMEGDLTIKHAQQIKESLIVDIDEHESFELDLTNITALDVTCIQLIYGLKKFIRSKEKSMDLKMNLSPDLENILKYNGLEQMLNEKTFRESL